MTLQTGRKYINGNNKVVLITSGRIGIFKGDDGKRYNWHGKCVGENANSKFHLDKEAEEEK
jgi:hypothetical protein